MRIDRPLFRTASIVLLCDGLARGAGAVSGLLAARWLSVEHYAYYTIATRMMGAIAKITQGGVTIGFTALIGRFWPDMRRAAEIISAARAVRLVVSAVALPALLLIAWRLLREAGADVPTALSIVALLALYWWADLRTSVVEQLLYFAHRTTRVQLLDLGVNAARLLGVVALYVADAFTAIAAVLLAVLVNVARIPPILAWIEQLLPKDAPRAPRREDRREIGAATRRQLPVDAYAALQESLVIAAVAFFGAPAVVAGYGALTRIIQLMTPFETLARAIYLPIFAKATTGLAPLYLRIVALAAAPSLCLVAAAAVAPAALLWLVGPNYAHLDDEMLIAAAVLALASFARTSWEVLAARGLNHYAWTQIPSGLAFMAVAAAMVDLSSVAGGLILSAGFAVGLLIAVSIEFAAARRRGAL